MVLPARSRRRTQTAFVLALAALAAVCGLVWLWAFAMSSEPGDLAPDTVIVPTRVRSLTGRAAHPAPPPQGYVGDAACAECHAEINRRFASSPMSRSMANVGDLALAALGEATVKPGGQCVYRVSRSGETGLTHHEMMYDAEGDIIYDQAVPVHYVIGSGTRGQSFVADFDGVLLMSPLSWYANGNRWDLSPGYRVDDPRRFGRRVSDGCLVCHVGRVEHRGDLQGVYAERPFPQLSIGCENCHGPGEEHVTARRGHDSATTRDSIVNPARLGQMERESICNQCHLQAAARVPRYGRSFFDFRPGQRLEEVVTVLDAGPGLRGEGKVKSVHHVQQMRASRCYQASEGKLGCTSCHDPHGSPNQSGRADFYRDRCLKCHDNLDCAVELPQRLAHASQNSCFECHMPRLSASDVAHTAQTDHRVLARPASEPEGDGRRTGRLVFFDNADERMEPWEVSRATGLGIVQHSLETGRPLIFSQLERLMAPGLERAPGDLPVLSALTEGALHTDQFDVADKYARQALAHDPKNEAALTALVLINHRSGNHQQGLEFARRLEAINPTNAALYGQYADLLRLASRRDEALAKAELGLQWNPRLIPVRLWLSNAYREAGRLAESEKQLSIIRRMENAPAAQ